MKKMWFNWDDRFVVLFVVLSLWFGLPQLKDWATTILPVTLGPAIVVGGYWLIAYLGHQRIEQEISAEDN